jgi:hypothetical protein
MRLVRFTAPQGSPAVKASSPPAPFGAPASWRRHYTRTHGGRLRLGTPEMRTAVCASRTRRAASDEYIAHARALYRMWPPLLPTRSADEEVATPLAWAHMIPARAHFCVSSSRRRIPARLRQYQQLATVHTQQSRQDSSTRRVAGAGVACREHRYSKSANGPEPGPFDVPLNAPRGLCLGGGVVPVSGPWMSR